MAVTIRLTCPTTERCSVKLLWLVISPRWAAGRIPFGLFVAAPLLTYLAWQFAFIIDENRFDIYLYIFVAGIVPYVTLFVYRLKTEAKLRYSIWQILVLMTLVAVVMVILRITWEEFGSVSDPLFRSLIGIVAVPGLFVYVGSKRLGEDCCGLRRRDHCRFDVLLSTTRLHFLALSSTSCRLGDVVVSGSKGRWRAACG